jgi:hypothetical protein
MGSTQAIYIQGCARSGNTLMRELCVTGFQGAKLVKVTNKAAECSLLYLVESLTSTRLKGAPLLDVLLRRQAFPPLPVASRDHATSLVMDKDLLRAHPGVKVLWMLRDPLDILTSIHAQQPGEFYVKPARLIESLKLYQAFKAEAQVLAVHYEELVANPNAVQARIAQTLQLKPLRDFTEGHKYFPRFRENVKAMHSIRPVDANSVQKWRNNPGYREYLQKVFAEHPVLISLARECGYEVNLA